MLKTARDRIALLDHLEATKWSRVRITDINYRGVGAVGPISEYYIPFINNGRY